jgi:flagellar biosynthesis protein FlhF
MSMNYKRFTARTSREALQLVKQAFGDDAVVLSNKRSGDGVEVLAMAPEGLSQIERAAASAPRAATPPATPAPQFAAAAAPAAPTHKRSFAERTGLRREPEFGLQDPLADARADLRSGSRKDIGKDVQTLAMSTLSFQDYVRERVLRRRRAELSGEQNPAPVQPQAPAAAPDAAGIASLAAARRQRAEAALKAMQPRHMQEPQPPAQPQIQATPVRRAPPVLRDEVPVLAAPNLSDAPRAAAAAAAQRPRLPDPSELPHRGQRDQQDMMDELRQVKGMIEERFGALAFMEKLQRQPIQARLTQRLLETGFSPALVRKLVEACPSEFGGAVPDESAWAANVLTRNLVADDSGPALEEQGGVFALIGSTGVGKTTTTAKLAAAFATRYGAGQLGLITLDAYRVGAHEQLRAYGRILGVPVHTAHDRTSLEDLLGLLSGKKMVLVDTAGMAQRDSRTTELLDMLKHPSVRKLLVVNAAQQGETIEDVVNAWRAAECHGVVLSKIDEAVKLGPALDTVIRHKLKVLGVANGQRVPEDWHRLSAQALVQRALKAGASGAWRMDSADVSLVFAGTPVHEPAVGIH